MIMGWKKKFLSRLSDYSEKNECIDYDLFCESIGVKDVDKTSELLDEWLAVHTDFDFIGDDYENLSMKNAILLKKDYSEDEEYSPELAEKFIKRARICYSHYSYDLAKKFFKQTDMICAKLAQDESMYYAYCGEAEMMIAKISADTSGGDPLSDYLDAVVNFENAMDSYEHLELEKLCCNTEDCDMFGDTENWLIFRYICCCHEIGNICFENMAYNRLAEGITCTKTSLDYYLKEIEYFDELSEKKCPVVRENREMYDTAIKNIMRCYSVLWDFENAEKYYERMKLEHKQTKKGSHFIASAYKDCGESRSDFSERESCFKRALEILLDNCYTGLENNNENFYFLNGSFLLISQVCEDLSKLYHGADARGEAHIYSELQSHYLLLYNNNTNVLQEYLLPDEEDFLA